MVSSLVVVAASEPMYTNFKTLLELAYSPITGKTDIAGLVKPLHGRMLVDDVNPAVVSTLATFA
jgi:hypothetical protein